MLELPRGREFTPSSRKIITPEQIADVRSRHAGQILIAAGGAFDLLHVGHVDFLERAKAQADVLFVLVSSDETLKKKGNNRPIQSQQDRARIVAALDCVDYVVPIGYAEGAIVLEQINPNMYAKGRDYSWESIDDYYKEVLIPKGIPVAYVGEKINHTSALISKIKES